MRLSWPQHDAPPHAGTPTTTERHCVLVRRRRLLRHRAHRAEVGVDQPRHGGGARCRPRIHRRRPEPASAILRSPQRGPADRQLLRCEPAASIALADLRTAESSQGSDQRPEIVSSDAAIEADFEHPRWPAVDVALNAQAPGRLIFARCAAAARARRGSSSCSAYVREVADARGRAMHRSRMIAEYDGVLRAALRTDGRELVRRQTDRSRVPPVRRSGLEARLWRRSMAAARSASVLLARVLGRLHPASRPDSPPRCGAGRR